LQATTFEELKLASNCFFFILGHFSELYYDTKIKLFEKPTTGEYDDPQA